MTAITRHRPVFRWRDAVREASASVLARPGRGALTVLGTVLGVASLVATLGLSKTAGHQIVGRFDELAATDVVVEPKAATSGLTATDLTWDAPARVTRLNGVVSAGTLSNLDASGRTVHAVPVEDPLGQTRLQLPLKAASPGLFDAVRAHVRTGRLPDVGHSDRADRVVVLGRSAAETLHITRVDDQPGIFIGEQLYVVLGIIDNVDRQPSLLGAVILPEGTARHEFGLRTPGLLQIDTRVGAASLIAGQVPLAVSPANPIAMKVTAPPEPRRVRTGVQSDLNSLFLLLGAVSLGVGALGIANVTLVSVLERVGEIGLRRALGAARRHVAQQFLLESTLLGFLGGILGAAVGTLVVVAVAASRTWTPVLDPWVPLGAPVLGTLIGLISGVYPAWRAAHMEPVAALRAG